MKKSLGLMCSYNTHARSTLTHDNYQPNNPNQYQLLFLLSPLLCWPCPFGAAVHKAYTYSAVRGRICIFLPSSQYWRNRQEGPINWQSSL